MAQFSSGKGLPCAWALLPGKSTAVYTFLVDALIEKIDADGTTHRPDMIILDFEAAMINVLEAKLLGVEIIGCQFHFRKNLWQKLQDLGLSTLYHQNPDFQVWINMIYALCYVPVKQVVEYYEKVILKVLDEKEDEGKVEEPGSLAVVDEEEEGQKDTSSWSAWLDLINQYVDYIDGTYIGKLPRVSSRNKLPPPRKKPLFQPQLWSLYNLMSSEEEASLPGGTNNMLESYNRTMNKLLGANSNIWQTIDSFIRQEAETRRVLVSNLAGLDLTVNQGRKKKVEQHHAMICSTVRRINDVSPTVYLKALARIINSDD